MSAHGQKIYLFSLFLLIHISYLNFQVTFELVYDEFLKMEEKFYTQDIRVNLDEEIEDLRYEVFINETVSIRRCDVMSLDVYPPIMRRFNVTERPEWVGSEVCHIWYQVPRIGVGNILHQII